MKINAPWLSLPETRAVTDMLERAGHCALFVGGCVRNALLNAPVSDLDIATDALPETVMALARDAGLKPVPTGIDHGTITVVSGGAPHEVTTFRHDVETDGRRAVVAFTDDVAEDARRRDFTMNALYCDSRGQLVDPLGGLPDLQARRVVFIEDPEQRIREDYLRILRFFRFTAWYGDGLDPKGLAACAALAEGIETLAKERIGQEMLKLLAAPDPAPALASMAQSGVLWRLLPGADPRALAPLVHLEGEAGVAPDPIRRLVALGGEKPAENLRLSRAQDASRHKLTQALASEAGAAELGYRLGAENARDVMLLRWALVGQGISADEMVAAKTGAAQRFPLTAADLIPDFQGPALGDALRRAEQLWIASGFTLGRDALTSQLKG